MQEEVSGSTTEGEWAPDGFGDGGANCFGVADVGGSREGRSVWMGQWARRVMTLGVGKRMAKVWGELLV
jgi:hypothetical protein